VKKGGWNGRGKRVGSLLALDKVTRGNKSPAETRVPLRTQNEKQKRFNARRGGGETGGGPSKQPRDAKKQKRKGPAEKKNYLDFNSKAIKG